MNETSIRSLDSETRAPLPLSSPEHALSAANPPEAIDEIKRWATEQGLRGAIAHNLFEGYCRRLEAHGTVGVSPLPGTLTFSRKASTFTSAMPAGLARRKLNI